MNEKAPPLPSQVNEPVFVLKELGYEKVFTVAMDRFASVHVVFEDGEFAVWALPHESVRTADHLIEQPTADIGDRETAYGLPAFVPPAEEPASGEPREDPVDAGTEAEPSAATVIITDPERTIPFNQIPEPPPSRPADDADPHLDVSSEPPADRVDSDMPDLGIEATVEEAATSLESQGHELDDEGQAVIPLTRRSSKPPPMVDAKPVDADGADSEPSEAELPEIPRRSDPPQFPTALTEEDDESPISSKPALAHDDELIIDERLLVETAGERRS